MKMQVPSLFYFVTFLTLSGCSTPVLQGRSDSRFGYVSKIYSPENLIQETPPCLSSLTSTQLATGQYVEISIHNGRLRRNLSAFCPKSIKLEVHDKVEVSPPYCQDGVIPEVRQILKRASSAKDTADSFLFSDKFSF